MPDATLLVVLDDGTRALVETSVTTPEAYKPFADEPSKPVEVSIEELKRAIRPAVLVVAKVREEITANLPAIDQAEVTFGLSMEGKLDAKIVSIGANATFEIKVTFKGADE